jgi:hypothetical protein
MGNCNGDANEDTYNKAYYIVSMGKGRLRRITGKHFFGQTVLTLN